MGREEEESAADRVRRETEQLEQYALDKLARKNLDYIVANDVSRTDAGFGSDRNEVHIYSKNGLVERIPLTAKQEVARRLLEIAVQASVAGDEPPSLSGEVHSLEP